jgi:hypothetical protein
MTWLQRYRVRHYVTSAIWILPLFGMVAAFGAAAEPSYARPVGAASYRSQGPGNMNTFLVGQASSRWSCWWMDCRSAYRGLERARLLCSISSIQTSQQSYWLSA